MLREIDKYLVLSGCSIYACDEKGIAEQFPVAINAEVTLPDLNFPTATANMMGNIDVPNQTALENLQLTISLGDHAQSARLRKKGVVTVIIRYAQQISSCESGEVSLGGYTITAAGLISGKGGMSLTFGEVPESDLTLSLVRYKVVVDDGTTLCEIDRPAGILKINGEDLRSELRNLL